MKICIDCRYRDNTGIGVYLRECLPFFLASGHTVVPLDDCRVKPFSAKELFAFPSSQKKLINSCDVFYSPYFSIPSGIKIPACVTIHDMIFYDMPGIVSPLGAAARKFFIRRAIKKSSVVFTVSEFSRSRILRRFGSVKTVVSYTGVQRSILNFNAKDVKKNNTILFIGSIKKHKGLDILLDAYFAARGKGLNYKLHIVGGVKNMRSKDDSIIRRISGVDFIVQDDSLGSDRLNRLIASAALLVQSSSYEGFGLPPLEAMTLGTKVLLSDIPVFREVYAGFPVDFYKSGDASSLEEKLLALPDEPCEPLVLPEELRGKWTFEKTSALILNELSRFDNGYIMRAEE